MDKYSAKYIDPEEKALIQDIKRMDVRKFTRPSKKIQTQLKRSARRYVEKESKMNIRIDPYELSRLKAKADMEGLKYQTLIKSVLHKYITGQLVEKRKKAV
jgi:predicted DNA binding CopG/RHH family protein